MNIQLSSWNSAARALVIGAGKAADAAAAGLQASGAKVWRESHADVLPEGAVKMVFDIAEAQLGGCVTALVFADTSAATNSTENIPLEAWRGVTAINLDTRFFCAAELARRAIAHKQTAAIVYLMGSAASDARSGNAAEAAAAGGILNLNMSLAVEWGRDNIRSNIIASRHVDSAEPHDVQALQTLGVMVAYYCSDYAAYITGSCVGIDDL